MLRNCEGKADASEQQAQVLTSQCHRTLAESDQHFAACLVSFLTN